MQVVVGLVALPLVALLMVLATRLEDGLHARASSLAPAAPLALTATPAAAVATADLPASPALDALALADAAAPSSTAV